MLETAENTETLGDVIAKSHSLVHDISFDLQNNNVGLAQEKLKELDMLLHGI